MLGWWIERGKLTADQETCDLLGLHLAHNRSRMVHLQQECGNIVECLATAGVSPLVFKGMDTALTLFPEPGCRPLSDFDICVSEEQWPLSEQCLADLGCTPGPLLDLPARRVWTPPEAPRHVMSLAFLHADDPWTIDLHSSLDRAFTPSVIAHLDCLRARDRQQPWAGNRLANVAGQPLSLLVLATHASQSMRSLTLIRLLELGLMIRRERDTGTLSWTGFQEAAEGIEAMGLVYPAFHFLDELVPELIPRDLLRRCEAAAPPPVRRCLRRYSAATIHRIDRWPVSEVFMWCNSWNDRAKQARLYLFPGQSSASLRQTAGFYSSRLRGALMRRGTRQAVPD